MLLEGCAPPAAADMGLITGAAAFGLLRQVVHMLEWPAHTPATLVQPGGFVSVFAYNIIIMTYNAYGLT